MPPKTSLAAHEISCQRGGRLLFRSLSFALQPGEGLLVTGPNGAGKTSLLRLIAGVLPPRAGHIESGDASVPLPELCHYVGHLNGIKNALTLRENANFWVDFLGGDGAGLEDAFEMFGLSELENLPAGLLSAGQKRKLALLRLFAAKRPIWLLDEPSVSLDAASGKVLDKVIARHLGEGGIAVVASHTPLKVKFAHELALKLEPLQ
jgi:heme exporter protein A